MDEDYFWKKLEGMYGCINPHLKNILRLSNLCSQSLSRLTRESILLIERDLREMADVAIEKALTCGPSLESVYGRYESRPHEFKFLEGEILCLLDLANIIEKYGIKKFIRPITIIENSDFQRHLESVTEKIERLRLKISAHFYKPKYHHLNHVDSMSNLMITDCSSPGQHRAEITCPLCMSAGKRVRLSATTDITGNWNIFSFTRHVDQQHPSQLDSVASQDTKRRQSIISEPSYSAYLPPKKLPLLMENKDIENDLLIRNDFIFNKLKSSVVSPSFSDNAIESDRNLNTLECEE